MPCFKPLSAVRYYSTEEGKRKISFGRHFENYDTAETLNLPCGQCIGCRLERSRRWAVRLMHEAKLHERNSFLTLTYDDSHVPADMSLNVEHFQLFMKRLRKRCSEPLRFFHCGEYGEQTARPHYHCCLFGEDFSRDRRLYRTTPRGDRLYNSDFLSDVWGLGHAVVGDLTFESAAYVARYCLKKVSGDAAASHYAGRRPEYVTMSRRPGIGAGWFERYMGDVYPSDEVIVRGRSVMPPPFYDKLLEKVDPGLFDQVKRAREREAGEFYDDPDNWSGRLLVQDEVKKQTVKHTLGRKL